MAENMPGSKTMFRYKRFVGLPGSAWVEVKSPSARVFVIIAKLLRMENLNDAPH
jgi:hypothetical protein